MVENAYTSGSDGRLLTYLPLLDSRAVDRAVSLDGGPPLYLQVKGTAGRRRDGRVSFAVPLAAVGREPRWVCAFAAGSTAAATLTLDEVYLVPGSDLLARAGRGRLVDGRPCLRLTLSPASPTWSAFHIPAAGLGPRLMALAAAPREAGAAAAPPAFERSQEEGRGFELQLAAAIVAATDRLALYQPAPDVAGRDLLVQLAGTDRHLYLQIKGTERLDSNPDLVRFQVRRRTYRPDPNVLYVFAYSPPLGPLGPVWAVPSTQLAERASAGDPEHLSFEPHIRGHDPRWGPFRLDPSALAAALLATLAQGEGPGGLTNRGETSIIESTT